MCLILFAWRSHPQYRLLLAANRDEFFARPAAPAQFWDDAPNILAGRDLEQGGTWLGVTRSGRFAAITNVRNPAAVQGVRSRGHLVRDFLDSNLSPENFIAQLDDARDQYSPFNLLLGNNESLHYCNSTGEKQELQSGIYGLSNAALDTPWPKVINGKQALANAIQTGADTESLFSLLASEHTADDDKLPHTGIPHELEKKLSACFIRIDHYGTRCSTLLLQSHVGNTTFHERLFDEQGQATVTSTFCL